MAEPIAGEPSRPSRRALLLGGAGLALGGAAGAGAWNAWTAWADAGEDAREARADGIDRVLARRAAAVRSGDAAALAATVAPGASALIGRQRQLVGNLAEVSLAQWSYRATGLDAYPLPPALGGGERVAVAVELSYRLRGVDRLPVTATQYQSFERQPDGAWLLCSDTDHDGGDVLLWDLGRVRVVRGRFSLVLGLREEAVLAAVAAEADQAVPAVSAVWGSDWGQLAVLLVPATAQQFGALLGADPAGFAEIAAVTTGELGAAESARTERITLNPGAWDGLSALGRQVVTTHETTHVATRAQTERWTPRWLSEGVADWTGYLATGRDPRQITPELGAALSAAAPADRARLLAALPSDAAFDGRLPGTTLQMAYQEAWFACRAVVLRHGQAGLAALYAAVAATGGAGGQEASLDRALRTALGESTAGLTAQWRADLQAEWPPPR